MCDGWGKCRCCRGKRVDRIIWKFPTMGLDTSWTPNVLMLCVLQPKAWPQQAGQRSHLRVCGMILIRGKHLIGPLLVDVMSKLHPFLFKYSGSCSSTVSGLVTTLRITFLLEVAAVEEVARGSLRWSNPVDHDNKTCGCNSPRGLTDVVVEVPHARDRNTAVTCNGSGPERRMRIVRRCNVSPNRRHNLL